MDDKIERLDMASAVASSSAQKLTTDDALTYLKAVKDLFHDKKEKYNEFLQVIRDFKSQRIDTRGVIAKVQELFKEHRVLLLGFSTFLPSGYEIEVPEEKKPVEFDEAFAFVNKIKSRFQDDEQTYKSFLGILNMHRMAAKSCREVYREVVLLFENHDDLLTEFLHFLPDTSASTSQNASSGPSVAGRGDKRRTMIKTARPPSMEKVENIDRKGKRERDDTNSSHERAENTREQKRINRGSPNVSEDAANNKLSSSCNKEDPKPISELDLSNKDKKRKRERDDTKCGHERAEIEREDKRINRGSLTVSKDAANNKPSSSCSKEDPNYYKPISELDFSNSERCTPSYRMLTENYRRPAASARTELDASVLNDVWVSVATGSEDHSSDEAKKNEEEDIFFRCEEDRYELDMLIESAKSAATRVEDLIKKMEEETIKKQSPFRIQDHLTALNMRCIERIYGDHGLEVMDVLSKNPSDALPVILARLRQKQEEWSRCRADFNKVWSEIYAENPK